MFGLELVYEGVLGLGGGDATQALECQELA